MGLPQALFSEPPCYNPIDLTRVSADQQWSLQLMDEETEAQGA